MKNFDWKRIVPHVVAIGIFLLVSILYCRPALEGKVLQQSDITQWKAMSKDIDNYKQIHGEAPLWTNGMFSGMPGYLIAGKVNNDLPYIFTLVISLGLPKPFQFFFLACICFYFLSQVLKINRWIGVIGSLAYAYATYNAVIVGVGHETKMLTIALIPGFIASLICIYEKKYLWGAALTALFTGAMVCQNHYQIVYYGVLIAMAITLAYTVRWIKAKQWRHLVIAVSITFVAGMIGVFTNAVVLFPNYEYTNASIRGGSILNNTENNTGKNGLGKDYAFSYSMHKSEVFVLLVPWIFGGSTNHMEVSEDKSKALEALQSMPQELSQQLQSNLYFYWGEAHTSGPPYLGAIICFLAILGFVVLDNSHKWWILATLIITVMMSWGRFFESFNTFLFNHLPMYNKFRAPGMIIVVPTFLLSMIGVLSLQKILFGFDDNAEAWREFKKGLMITGGILLSLLLLYFSLDYQTDQDRELLKNVVSIQDEQVKTSVRSFLNGLKEDRQALFMSGILRSIFFIAIAAAAIWMYQRKILKAGYVLAVIGLFSFIDVMAVDVKYLNADNYQEKEEYEGTFTPSAADQKILEDKSYYRVLNIAGGNVSNAFNHGAMPSYFHKSIGGYHPAKLSIYQDLIEKQLYKFPNCQPVLNMLNTKYIIHGDPQNPQVQINPSALGAAWFVRSVKFVSTPQEEMAALDNLNTKDTAVANKSYNHIIKQSFFSDTSATIQLLKNDNDIISYKSKSSSEQLAVFSEIHYDKGWNSYIDGKKTDHAKVNYVLRGLMVPSGEHTIVFKFEPASHKSGWTITVVCTILTIVLLLVVIYMEFKTTWLPGTVK